MKNTCPYMRLKRTLRRYSPRMLLRLRRLNSVVMTLDEKALLTWREGHGVFFTLVQGVALELRRFKAAVDAGDLNAARRHIDRATAILIGSATAMRLAGDVDRGAYAGSVVPAMVKAHPRFSGSDSSDHDFLVQTYRALSGIVGKLPAEIAGQYDKFRISVEVAIAAHVEVCDVHRGNERKSSGSGGQSALTGVETLMRLGAQRLKLLVPKTDCPYQAVKRRVATTTGTNGKNNRNPVQENIQ